jgi:hypothetical protein
LIPKGIMQNSGTLETDFARKGLDNTRHHVAYSKWHNTRSLKLPDYLEFTEPRYIGGSKVGSFQSLQHSKLLDRRFGIGPMMGLQN